MCDSVETVFPHRKSLTLKQPLQLLSHCWFYQQHFYTFSFKYSVMYIVVKEWQLYELIRYKLAFLSCYRKGMFGNRPGFFLFYFLFFFILKMDWIRSNESGLGFSSLVHRIYSLGKLIQFLCTPLFLSIIGNRACSFMYL